jgi:hypothetical protein
MTRLATRILIVAGIVCLLLAFLWLRSCDQARSAKTTATLAKGQTGAAVESGHDAVETLGNTNAREAEGQKAVEETRREIDNASDVLGVVDAGRAGLCRQPGHRC